MLIWITAGACLAALVARFVVQQARPIRSAAIGLAVVASIYAALGLASASPSWIALELGGVALFGGIAWFGWRHSAWWLVAGWVGHVAWDVGLHLERSQPVVGPWYPQLCIGFDLVVAGLVLAIALTTAGTQPRSRRRVDPHARS
ncbi:MAG: hypothetical protein AB1635_20490 [Acidobacteriota bacterium]